MKQRKKNPDPSPNNQRFILLHEFLPILSFVERKYCDFIFSGYDYGFISLGDALRLHPNTMLSFYTEWLI